MRIFLTGVSCIGKTTIGTKLAALFSCPFFNMDVETERFFGASIERLRGRFLSSYSYRKEASKALKHLLSRRESLDCVIELPPSGLMDSYWKLVKKAGGTTVALLDKPENILKRITFYDIDSRPIHKTLSSHEERYYLRDIRADISYFGRTYKRADLRVDVAGIVQEEAALRVKEALIPFQ